MASPVFEAVGVSSQVVVASGNLTLVSTGGNFAVDDIVFACIAYRSNAAFTLPAGWTLVAQESTGNTSTTASTAIASGCMAWIKWTSPAPSLAFTRTAGDVAQGVLVGYRGQKGTGPIDVVSSATLGANSVTAATGTITTANNNELIVAMVAGADNGTTSNFRAATSPTTGSGATVVANDGVYNDIWQERYDANTTTGADTSLSIGDVVKLTAGATGELRATHSTTSRHVMIAAAVISAETDRAVVQASKLSRYDMMEPNNAAVSVAKFSRYDILSGIATVSATKFSRYDILKIPTQTITGALFTDTDVFYGGTVVGGETDIPFYQPGGFYFPLDNIRKRKRVIDDAVEQAAEIVQRDIEAKTRQPVDPEQVQAFIDAIRKKIPKTAKQGDIVADHAAIMAAIDAEIVRLIAQGRIDRDEYDELAWLLLMAS